MPNVVDPGHRVAIDALAARFGGTAYAAIQLAKGLARRPDVELVLVVTRRGSIIDRGLDSADGLLKVVLAPEGAAELPRRLAWEAFRLPRVLEKERCTALISYSGMLPRWIDCPVGCHLLNPVALTDRGAGNAARRVLIERTSGWAADLMAPSHAMAELIQEKLGADVRVVALGVDHDVFSPADHPGEQLLCVADFYPHKRHDLLISAWSLLPEPRPRLVLIGNPAVDRGWYDHVRELAADVAADGKIEFLAGASLGSLVSQYRMARALVIPSVRESFCMPVVEAAACGVPAVLTDIDVLRETGGDGADFIDDEDPAIWADAIARLYSDNQHHATKRAAAIEHSRAFSWERMTEEVVKGLRGATARPAPARRWPLPAGIFALLVLALVTTIANGRKAVATNAPAAAITPHTAYGAGFGSFAPAGIPSLRPFLGDRWRVLPHGKTGHAALWPAGRPGPYFTVSLAVSSPRPARLEIVTAQGERGLAGVAHAGSIINFGPFRANAGGAEPIGIALQSIDPSDSGHGPPLVVSPIEAVFQQPGSGFIRMAALAQGGPHGLRGLDVPAGSRATVRVTPGVRGAVDVRLGVTPNSHGGKVGVRVAGTRRQVRLRRRATSLTAGPFPHGAPIVTVTVPKTLRGGVLLSSLAVVPAEPHSTH